jgi:cobyrinic acid a,c-diamide synthase
MIAGLSGGSGKTIVSLALARALAASGLSVRPFKKGPDYIDAVWLGLAAGREAVNLDPFLFPRDQVRPLFAERMTGCQIGLIEGNRGLFDGKDTEGSFSSAELARILDAPVVLVIDCTKMTRTAAAIVQGCRNFEPGLTLAGVVLNRTAGERHRQVLRSAIETYTDVPVLGLLPKISENPIPERHMGLISSREYDGEAEMLSSLTKLAHDWLDLPALLAVARQAPDLEAGPVRWPAPVALPPGAAPRIGYVRDAALWFYYPENLEALTRAGAELVELSLVSPEPWPEIHGLYLGGGFPETQAARLAANTAVRERVRDLSRAGLPIYAECGGFMYLCASLWSEGADHPMAGVLDLSTELCARPQGLGYVEARVKGESPFFTPGAAIRGHEFHYSRCARWPDGFTPVLSLSKGCGMCGGQDGLLAGNTYAAYTHIHALGVPEWAPNFVAAAARWKAGRED